MKIKIVIFYKNSKSSAPTSGGHYGNGGLATNALHSVAVLKQMGLDATLVQVRSIVDVKLWLHDHPDTTHCIIEAVWVTVDMCKDLCAMYPDMVVVVRAHSKIGFLQVEPEAIPVMRAIIEAGKHLPNLYFASNNQEFAGSLTEVYGDVLYLPNLYDLADAPPRARGDGALRIASFGASRLLKLHPAAALAALQIADRLRLPLEFYINKDSTPGGDSVRKSVQNLLKGLEWATLVEVGWQDSQQFKETIATMDLVFQTSATETFCMVAADAVASGVPVVTGQAITWVPSLYQASVDDTSALADVGIKVLKADKAVAKAELKALTAFVASAKEAWNTFLKIPKVKRWWQL